MADVAALVVYLEQAFEVPELGALARKARAGADPILAAGQGFTRPFYRLLDPDVRPEVGELLSIPGLTGAVTARALHCDWLPLPPDYLHELDRLAARGGYALTHAVLASVWIEENGCQIDRAVLARLRDRSTSRLLELLDARAGPTDLLAEAMAMLCYGGHGGRLTPAHVQTLLRARRDDGGWPLDEDRPASHPHTTVLALWVLLDVRHRPSRVHVPMIRARAGR